MNSQRSDTRRIAVGLFFAVLLVTTGCEKEKTSLFDPNRDEGTPPEITGIVPADSASAGSTITIEGNNFLSDPEANYVYFESTEAEIESASPSELKVVAPDMTGENIEVQAATRAAEDFSNTVVYELY